MVRVPLAAVLQVAPAAAVVWVALLYTWNAAPSRLFTEPSAARSPFLWTVMLATFWVKLAVHVEVPVPLLFRYTFCALAGELEACVLPVHEYARVKPLGTAPTSDKR